MSLMMTGHDQYKHHTIDFYLLTTRAVYKDTQFLSLTKIRHFVTLLADLQKNVTCAAAFDLILKYG